MPGVCFFLFRHGLKTKEFFLFLRRVSTEEDLPPVGHDVARQRILPTVRWGRYTGTAARSIAVIWI